MAQVLVQKACAKLRSAIPDEAVARLNFTGDLWEMLEMLESIQLALENAERPLVFDGEMMAKATGMAYRVMKMADELQDAWPPPAPTMRRMLPCLTIKKNAMATKVKDMNSEVIRLKNDWDNWENPAITQQQQRLMDGRAIVASFVEASVFGRGADKQRIVDMLLSAARKNTQGPTSCTVLPIFGFPGSGKTTLALMVFNDTHSLQEYNFRVWVHVSPELDFHRVCESILCQVMSGGGAKEKINDQCSNPDVAGMERIMKRLHELFNGKKVLLVLDDLWEEDLIQLQLLKSMLTFPGDKVDVIVTTCNQAIARKICTVESYRLNPLGDDMCWEIIRKSFCFLEEHGLEIASKCWGLPSMAQAFAIWLNNRDPSGWEMVMRKYMPAICFEAFEESQLLQSTMILIYISMPPDLRLCFDYYCAIFQEGQNIAKDDLIHQWIALTLIEPSETSSATKIAEGYITRLLDTLFFQTAVLNPASGIDDKSPTMFTMHNLAHGVAKMMLQIFCQGLRQYMRLSNYRGKLDDWDVRALHCVGCSRIEFNDGSFSSNRSLRVLELKESHVSKLPVSICKLRHLEYLKITEFSRLVTLPESFGDLTNLFHIDLSDCSGLAVLPESFGDLINLSHVKLSRCHGLAKLPKPLKKLGKLVHLDLSFWSCFEEIGKGLGGLTNLEHLNLSNPCCHLAQQRSHLQGLKDGLCKLTRLRYLNLSMCLNPIFYYKPEEDSLSYIESCLSGLSSLEHLDLSHNTFLFDLPQSLGDLNRLHTLNLSGCIRLKKVGEMKSPKFISLRNCRGLESCNFVVCCVIDDDDAYSSSNIVQLEEVNCQELQISCLEKVRSKEEAQRIKLVEKEKLGKLKLSWTLDSIRSVEDSGLLGELVPSPNLQCLQVNGYHGTCLPEYLGDLTSLQELKIISCKQLSSLPDSIQTLTNLKDLCIVDCPELVKWCQEEGNKIMLTHITKKKYEPEMEEDCKSIDDVEAA